MQLVGAPSPEEYPNQEYGMQQMADAPQYGYPQQMQGPMMQQPPQNMSRDAEERIQEITEAIVDEKWQKLTQNIGDISVWEEGVQTEIESVKQEVLRVEQRIERLEQTIIGKVTEYQKSLTEVNTEMQALGKVFEKILQPLTSNIKELARITKELKTKSK